MPAFTPKGIKYPLPADAIKSAASPSKLAEDFKDQSFTTDAAIDSAIGSLPARVTAVETKNTEQDVRLVNAEAYHTRSSRNPASTTNRVAGDMHFNEVANTLWVVNRATGGELSWVELPSRMPERGNIRLAVIKNPNTWMSATYNGIWDVPNTSSLNGAVTDGYTPPLMRAHKFEHYTSSAGISYQRAQSYDPARSMIRSSTQPGAPMGEWTELHTDRGSARLATEKDPDKWYTKDFNGPWDLPNTSSIDGAVADGYTAPARRAHYLEHYTSMVGVAYQQAYLYAPDRMFFRATPAPNVEMGEWNEVKKLTVESDMRTIFCVGESTTRGGDSGVDWPLADAYPAKLQEALGGGVTVENAGKGGAFTDEILLRSGRKRTFINVPSGSLPTTATPVQISWKPDTDGARWIEIECRVNNVQATLNLNGTTGAWTAKRRFTGAAIVVTGWTEIEVDAKSLEGGVHILWIGGNDSTRQIKGPHKDTASHIIAGIQAYKQSLPAENHSLIVLGMHTSMPEAGNSAKRLQDTLAVNKWCADNIPNEFISMYDYMRGRALVDLGITPTAEDLTLMSDGYVPRSVLADAVHPTKALANAIAVNLLAPYIRDRGLVFAP